MAKPGGFLYAIAAEGTGLVKIGYTRASVEQRLAILQIGQPCRLSLVASMPVDADAPHIEAAVHRFLAPTRQRGEWFAVSIADDQALAHLVTQALQTRLDEQAAFLPGFAPPTPQRETLFGDRLRQLRMNCHLTQAALAQRLHVPQPYISRWESGVLQSITFEHLRRLATGLRTTTDSLLGLDDTAP